MKDLPIYKITLEEDEAEAGLTFVSLVKDPAIGIKGLAFANDTFEFKFNEEKQIVAGPALVPDKLIYRNDPNIGEFYVVFTKDEIEKFVTKFNKSSKEYKINLDHDSIVESAFINANWIIESPEYDKSRFYGFNDLPEGTWFIEVKVDNPQVWEEQIKGQAKYGFSVEGFFGLELKLNKQTNTMNKLKFAEAKLADGTTIYTSGLEIGAEVYVIDENLDKVPVFDGEHILADGSVVVTVDGKITEYKPKSEAEEMKKDYKKEKMKDEVIDAELQDEVIAEVPAEVATIDEAKVLEIIQPKLDEIYAAIAEIKTLIEQDSIEPEEIEMKEQKFNSHDALISFMNFSKRK